MRPGGLYVRLVSVASRFVPSKPVLDSFVFQVIFGAGYTYLDRCGQTMVDIERARPDWVPGEVTVQSGNMANEKSGMNLLFSWDRFNFTAMRGPVVEEAAAEAQVLWDVVRENLNLSEFVRVGVRFQWILAREKLEHAERALEKAAFNVVLPSTWKEAGFAQANRSMVAGLQRDGVEYRVALQAGTRTVGLSPAMLATAVEPRMLPKGRQDAQKEAVKNRQKYNVDPMFVVNLDVDCVTFTPASVKPRAYIEEQFAVVQREFVPVLEGL